MLDLFSSLVSSELSLEIVRTVFLGNYDAFLLDGAQLVPCTLHTPNYHTVRRTVQKP
jgi:hypothetical protein